MQIQRIDFLPRTNHSQIIKPVSKAHSTTELRGYSYNPIAYVDYNVSFGARLFRTPANFYEQPFNKKGMPETMKDYLNGDYVDRQNMPPAQMLRFVFDDINEAKSLEQVKRIYPNEPLFKNLTDIPNRKARKGLISELDTLSNETNDIPLFKNGNSNFGMYLLKKIYIEGKSLKEINKDFKKDLNPIYFELIDAELDYSVPAAYGIKFPDNAFWKSFTATREDFPYVYRPRKIDGSRISTSLKKELTLSDIKSGNFELPQKPPRYRVTDRELRGFSDAIMAGGANPDAVSKNLKNKGFKDNENASFVQKYFGQIVTVALERINASDEMRSCFENMVTKKQVDRMNHYWVTHPQMKVLQAMAMSDTIKLFFDAYGVDGNNPEFKELLLYADSIKPEREARRAEHDRLQEEYNELLGVKDEHNQTSFPIEFVSGEVPDEKTPELTREILEDIASQYGAEVYEFKTPQGIISICSNLNEALEEYWKKETAVLPSAYTKGLINFIKSDPRVSDSYILTSILNSQDIKIKNDDRLLPYDAAADLDLAFQKEYAARNFKSSKAAEQAVTDAIVQLAPSLSVQIYNAGILDYNYLLTKLSADSNGLYNHKKDFVNKQYYFYKKELSEPESRKLAISYMDLLSNYDIEKSFTSGDGRTYAITLAALSKILIKNKEARNIFKNKLAQYLKDVYGGSARVVADKNIPLGSKMGKMERVMFDFFNHDSAAFLTPIYRNFSIVGDFIKKNDLLLYKTMTSGEIQDLVLLEDSLKNSMS